MEIIETRYFIQDGTGAVSRTDLTTADPDGEHPTADAGLDDSWVEVTQEAYEAQVTVLDGLWATYRQQQAAALHDNAQTVYDGALPGMGPAAALVLAQQIDPTFTPEEGSSHEH